MLLRAFRAASYVELTAPSFPRARKDVLLVPPASRVPVSRGAGRLR
jgi:hypothetical protein